jgi:peptidoglycan/LPS O-acetylase OafA/YrhL
MIQRIQSIWLLLASLLAFCTIKFAFYSGTDINNIPYQKLTGATGGFLILTVTILVGLLAGIAIFLFKNRNTQLWLCVGGIVAELLLLFLYYKQMSLYTQGELSLTSILHPAILLFFILAARGIISDKKLIQDSDRLR